MPVLVAGLLLGFLTLALHALVLLNGAFPAFGVLLTGQTGMAALASSILLLVALTWGVLEARRWAWWGTVVGLAGLVAAAVVTLLQLPFSELYAAMRFAPTEMEILGGMPEAVQQSHLAVVAVLPLLVTLGLLLCTRRYYSQTVRR